MLKECEKSFLLKDTTAFGSSPHVLRPKLFIWNLKESFFKDHHLSLALALPLSLLGAGNFSTLGSLQLFLEVRLQAHING